MKFPDFSSHYIPDGDLFTHMGCTRDIADWDWDFWF